jgi:hypothetical protein
MTTIPMITATMVFMIAHLLLETLVRFVSCYHLTAKRVGPRLITPLAPMSEP